MKRTRINRRSTKPRPESDPALVAEYRERFAWCEGFPVMCRHGQHDGHHIHHIAESGRRWDLTGNIIHLCYEAHSWVHANPVDGTVLCLERKRLKGELSEADWNRASVKRLPGWLDVVQDRVTLARVEWSRLVEHFEDGTVGKSQRDKGKAGERELSHKLTELFGTACRRGQQYCGTAGDSDVVGLPGVHIESKRTETLRLWDAIGQAVSDAANGDIPVVCHRPSRREWVAIVRLSDLPALAERLYLALTSDQP